jgi:hypothetical protein
MKKTIYIAGKVTGMEAEAAVLFQEAETALIQLGYEVVNPMKLDHNHDKKWLSYMKVCYRAMIDCDGIYLLSNWIQSKGAKDELMFALQLRLELINKSEASLKHSYFLFRARFFLSFKKGINRSLINNNIEDIPQTMAILPQYHEK